MFSVLQDLMICLLVTTSSGYFQVEDMSVALGLLLNLSTMSEKKLQWYEWYAVIAEFY
jgi:hypothetical protein